MNEKSPPVVDPELKPFLRKTFVGPQPALNPPEFFLLPFLRRITATLVRAEIGIRPATDGVTFQFFDHVMGIVIRIFSVPSRANKPLVHDSVLFICIFSVRTLPTRNNVLQLSHTYQRVLSWLLHIDDTLLGPNFGFLRYYIITMWSWQYFFERFNVSQLILQ